MKLAQSGSRGVFWRVNDRGTQEKRLGRGLRERGDWWIRWSCPHGHLHRKLILVGPKSLAQQEAERHRVERPCPARLHKPVSYLVTDVIREHLANVQGQKRSYKDDKRYGDAWSARFKGRTLDEVTTAELEKIRVERLKTPPPAMCETDKPRKAVTNATVNREFAFLKHVFNIAVRDGKNRREPSGQAQDAARAERPRALPLRRRGSPTNEGSSGREGPRARHRSSPDRLPSRGVSRSAVAGRGL
jgi:hypothetical protein